MHFSRPIRFLSYTLLLFLCMTRHSTAEAFAPSKAQDRTHAAPPSSCTAPADGTISFSGFVWQVKEGHAAPGPNRWSARNVCVDEQGHLHLKITRRNGVWTSAEIFTRERFGFGTYEFQIIGRIDRLDPNVVLGMFAYPPQEVGTDGTNEIDIEFARWGSADSSYGGYTVWPANQPDEAITIRFEEPLYGTHTTHRFVRHRKHIRFQSFHGHHVRPEGAFEIGPVQITDPPYLPEAPLPVHLNLWLNDGQPPTDGEEVEIILKSFRFLPEGPSGS